LGTASILISPTNLPVYDPGLRIPSYPHIERNQFVLEAVVSAAGISFRWLKELFNAISGHISYDYNDIVAISEKSIPGSNGIKFFPHLSGATCPFWNPKSTGVFSGISLDTSMPEIARSLLEGWCYQLKSNVLVIEELIGSREDIFVFGGGAKNLHFLQLLANILGRPIRICSTPETALLGAALLAGFGAGVYSNLDEAKALVRKDIKIIENDITLTQIYGDLYEAYRLIENKLIQIS
jgi:xylulokinase